MTPLRMCYLGLAIWGAVHPMVWFVLHMHQTGAGLGGLIAAFYANAATTGLTWDLSIAAMTLSIWVIAESRQRRHWRGLLALPATFCIGLSCGLPLYLFLRSRTIAR